MTAAIPLNSEQLVLFEAPAAERLDLSPDAAEVRVEIDELLAAFNAGDDQQRRYCLTVLPQLTKWLPEDERVDRLAALAA